MRPDGVVVDAPLLDQDLGFPQAVEDFAIEQLIPEPGTEAPQYPFSEGDPGSM